MVVWETGPSFRPDGTQLVRDANDVTAAVGQELQGRIAQVTERVTFPTPASPRRFARLRYALP